MKTYDMYTAGEKQKNDQQIPNGKQFRDRLLPAGNAAASIDTRVFLFSFAACLILAWTGQFERINMIFYSGIAFLVINAAVCATFAGVFDRYQGRVAWIMPFCLTAYGCSLVGEWKRSSVGREPIPVEFEYDAALPADSGAYAGAGQVSFTSEVQEES